MDAMSTTKFDPCVIQLPGSAEHWNEVAKFDQPERCDCCGKKCKCQRVDTRDFHGNFCPICCSMMEQTTRDDGSSRLHPSHLKQLNQLIKFNQASGNIHGGVNMVQCNTVIVGAEQSDSWKGLL